MREQPPRRSPTGWTGVSAELKQLIERTCTRAQITVLKLKADGLTVAAIAIRVERDEEYVIRTLHAAERLLQAEVAAMRGIA